MTRCARRPSPRLLALPFALALLLATQADLAVAQGQRPPPEARKTQIMRKPAFEKIEPVQELLSEGKPQEALAKLEAISVDRFNEYEKAVTYQMFGYAYSAQENYRKAIEFFEKALATGMMAPEQALDLKFNVAQLYRAVDQLDKSLRLFEEWLAEEAAPSGTQHFQIASTYYQAEKFAQALPLAEKAVASSTEPPEGWLNLVVALYLDDSLKSYTKALPFVEQLATRFPKPAYWKQLAAIYSELKMEKSSLVALELTYQQGFMTTNTELRRLAESYLYHEIPYKAAILLEKEIASGRMEKSERNWELLANAWFQAREVDKAVAPLEKAGALAKTGEHFMTVAQLHIDSERWDEALASLEQALNKGGLDSPGKAHLLRGIALFNLGQSGPARSSFTAAQRYEATRKLGAQWLRVVRQREAADAAE